MGAQSKGVRISVDDFKVRLCLLLRCLTHLCYRPCLCACVPLIPLRLLHPPSSCLGSPPSSSSPLSQKSDFDARDFVDTLSLRLAPRWQTDEEAKSGAPLSICLSLSRSSRVPVFAFQFPHFLIELFDPAPYQEAFQATVDQLQGMRLTIDKEITQLAKTCNSYEWCASFVDSALEITI